MGISPFDVGLFPSRKESRVPQHSNSRADLFLPLPSFATNPQYHISKVHPSQPKVHPPGTGTTASTHDRTGCKADTTHTHPNAPASKTRPSIHTPGLLPSARRAPAKLTPGTQTSPLGPRHVTMTRQPEPTVATGPHTSQASITTIPNPKPVAPRFARPPCAALRLRSSLSIYIYRVSLDRGPWVCWLVVVQPLRAGAVASC